MLLCLQEQVGAPVAAEWREPIAPKSLIFGGPLNGFVPAGIRMALTTALVVGTLVTLSRASGHAGGSD